MASYAFEVNESGEIKPEKDEENDMEEKEKEIKRLTDELNAANTKLATSEGESKTYKTELEVLKKEKADGLKTARTDEVKEFCEQMVKDGKMTPAARDILTKDLDKHVYTDEAGFSITFDAFKKCFETHAKVFDITEKGKEGEGEGEGEYKTVSEELAAKTTKYIADHKDVNYAEASKAVLDSDKELAKRYALEDL